MAEKATTIRPQRLRAEGRGFVVEVWFAEVGVAHAGHAQLAGHQAERVEIRDGAEHQVRVIDLGGDEPLAGGLDGGVDGLDGLLGGREIGPDDGVDVSDLPHGFGP